LDCGRGCPLCARRLDSWAAALVASAKCQQQTLNVPLHCPLLPAAVVRCDIIGQPSVFSNAEASSSSVATEM